MLLVWWVEVVAVEDEDDHDLFTRPGGDEERLDLVVWASITRSGIQVNFIASE